MKMYTITSHVADQVATLEAASARRRRLLKPIIGVVALLTLGAAALFWAQNQAMPAVASVGIGGLALLLLGVAGVAGPSERDVAIKRAGAAGEAVLPQLLRSLPDSYTLLNGVPVPGSRADIDHVLVGPNGIWAIEAKNHVGMVQCVGEAWGYSRLGRGGIPVAGHIGSPSEQAQRHAAALERFLHRRNVVEQVQPVVVFTHPRVELSIEQPTVPIFRAKDGPQFFAQGKQFLSPRQTAQIVETLRQLRPLA